MNVNVLLPCSVTKRSKTKKGLASGNASARGVPRKTMMLRKMKRGRSGHLIYEMSDVCEPFWLISIPDTNDHLPQPLRFPSSSIWPD